MTTFAGTQDNPRDLVTSLLNLEKDALEAYDSVVERLEDVSYKSKIADFREDHYRHVNELTEYATSQGYEIPDGTAKSMLTSGKIVLADMFGDNVILKAMRTNEEDTVSAYDNALKQECCTGVLRDICTRARADEMRHREWMQSVSQRKAA